MENQQKVNLTRSGGLENISKLEQLAELNPGLFAPTYYLTLDAPRHFRKCNKILHKVEDCLTGHELISLYDALCAYELISNMFTCDKISDTTRISIIRQIYDGMHASKLLSAFDNLFANVGENADSDYYFTLNRSEE